MLGILILAVAFGIVYLNNSNDNNKNTTIENISNTNITEQNNTTNTSNDSTSTEKPKSTTKKSQSKSSSNYDDGGSDVDSNGYMKSPPDDSGNWVVVNGKWKPAVTYKNGHYYDYHGDNVDHKMK